MSNSFLVTGATGFLGGHLVRRLLQGGATVTVLHRSNPGSKAARDGLKDIGADVVTFGSFDEIEPLLAGVAPDAVFHLATLYTRTHLASEITALVESNVTFGTHLLNALAGSPAPVVSTMSFFQYRDSEPMPYSLYSATKEAFSTVSRYYRAIEGLDIREVVLYDTYGPGDTRDKLVPYLLDAFAGGASIGLGTSRQLLDLLFADDVADGLIAAAAPGNPPNMSLRAPSTVSVGDLVDRVREVTGLSTSVSFDESNLPNDLVSRSGGRPLPLGWAAQHTLVQGLAESWEHIQHRL